MRTPQKLWGPAPLYWLLALTAILAVLFVHNKASDSVKATQAA